MSRHNGVHFQRFSRALFCETEKITGNILLLFQFGTGTWGLFYKSNTIYHHTENTDAPIKLKTLYGWLGLRSSNDYLDSRARLRLNAGF